MAENSGIRSTALRLAAFGAVLALALGGGALVGATLGPDSADDAASHEETMVGSDASEVPPGLAVSRDGYTLDFDTSVVKGDRPAVLSFVIEGPDGGPVENFQVEHDKELHLVIVGRDLAGYAHVHPTRDADGVWSVKAPPLAPGSYRVFADFVPAGGDGLTLGTDLTVPGEYVPVELAAPSPTASVDGYDVSFDGELVAGTESELTVTVTRDGQPVSDLEPYLGALGHLVAIRDGDLAYLHVHPLDETDGPGGPGVRFAVEVPTDGTYGLFFDFSHAGDVHTAATIAIAAAGPAAPASGGEVPPADHDTHGG